LFDEGDGNCLVGSSVGSLVGYVVGRFDGSVVR
jgi:membrane protein YqaA with SNARE-associated domain